MAWHFIEGLDYFDLLTKSRVTERVKELLRASSLVTTQASDQQVPSATTAHPVEKKRRSLYVSFANEILR
jgi:hypothetical protein